MQPLDEVRLELAEEGSVECADELALVHEKHTVRIAAVFLVVELSLRRPTQVLLFAWLSAGGTELGECSVELADELSLASDALEQRDKQLPKGGG